MKNIKKLKLNIQDILKTNKILTQIILSYLTILLLMMGIHIGISKYTKGLLIEKEIKYNKMAMDYTKDLIDQKFNELIKESRSFLKDALVKNSIQNVEEDHQKDYLISRLKEFKAQDELVEFVVLYNANGRNSIFNEGSVETKNVFNEYFVYKDYAKDNILNTIEKNNLGWIPSTSINTNLKHREPDKRYLTFYCSIPDQAQQSKLFIIIPEEKIIRKFKDIYGESKFAILSNEGEFVVSSKNYNLPIELQKEILHNIKIKKENNLIQNKNCLVMYDKAKNFNWNYVMITDYKNIVKDAHDMRMVMIGFVLVLFIISGIIIVISIKTNYYPINNIINYLDSNENHKGKSELDRLNDGVVAMIKQNKHYSEVRTLYHAIKYGEKLDEMTLLFKYSLVVGVYIICEDINDIYLLKNKLIDNISNIEIKIVYADKNQAYIIVNGDQLEHHEIEINLWQCKMDELKEMIIGIGSIQPVKDLKISCEASVQAIREGMIYSPHHIYNYHKMVKPKDIYMPLDFESNMINYIYTANKERAREMIEDIFDKNAQITHGQLKKLVLDFINSYIKLAVRLDLDYNVEKLQKMAEKEYNIDCIKQDILGAYESLIFEQVVDQKSQCIGNYIKNYIENHYMDFNVTIELIAEELGLTSTYVSTLFKKEVGIAFCQYLSDYRIDKAKYVLIHTDKKVKDIAAETGFGTYSHFARVFKKKTGMIPSQYRENIYLNKDRPYS